MKASKEVKKYMKDIEKEVAKSYKVAGEARSLGYDPEDNVEPILARDMAERVEGLISTVAPQIKGKGVIERIKELEKEYNLQDWRVAFKISLEVTQEKFCKFKSKKEAMEVGLRTGLAYVTNGVVASPLEGFTKLELKKRRDGKEYFSLYFAGPIRSAGTTAVCIFVAVADYVRDKMGYGVYDPSEDEVRRMVTELYDYHERITNLQYLPFPEEIDFMVRNLPVQIDGDASEKREVSNYKDLDRIGTNTIRNGPCLAIGEGLTQKAAKFYGRFSKWMDDFDMGRWKFLDDFIKLQRELRAGTKAKGEEDIKILPDYSYIKEIVAGRPVLTHPMNKGGFRLRYGRCRNSGFSSDALHPSTMVVLKDYIAIGTQLKVERPGKATVVASCDTIEGPIVKLKTGEVLFLDTEEKARKYVKDIEEILFLGDILINYGDFFSRAHRLIPCGYNEEWYSLELEKTKSQKDIVKEIIKNPLTYVSAEEAIKLSRDLDVPLHPKYTYHWHDITISQFNSLINWVKNATVKDKKIIIPIKYSVEDELEDKDPKRVLELLGVPHKVANKEYVLIEGDDSIAFYESLNIDNLDNIKVEGKDVLEMVNKISGIKIRDKSGIFIGARMGRPEKAKMRKLTGSPHVLFPVGNEGGKMRSFQAALEKGRVSAEFPLYYCSKCSKDTIYRVCESCGERTKQKNYCNKCKDVSKNCRHETNTYSLREVDIKNYYDSAMRKLKIDSYDGMIKGVRGMSNRDSVTENLVKGVLRAKHNIFVNKDGTVRYDMTETAITHFKPKEVGTSIEKLKEMGYEKDIYGKELKNEDQILELKVQDVILPANKESLDEGADEVLFRISKFIDDLLVKLYGKKKFYNLKKKQDLVGHLILGLSPHTSAGMVGRIVGFSDTHGFYTHPLFHSAMRRDCDGDESGVMLLMDVLLNFSKKFLPSHRGTTQDAPIVLTPILIPSEVDDMVFDMDVVWKYPLELYEAAMNYKFPWEVDVDRYGSRLEKEGQYEGLGFTHDTGNINGGVRCSAYKSIPTMMDKVLGQMDIADKLRAVDEADVARLIIEKHFMRDIKGNLRKFSTQQFRCVDCNEKYRRPPLKGKCKCNGKIIFTVAEGSIVKYLEPSIQLAEKYTLPAYLKQTLDLTKKRIEGVFGREEDKQEGLVKWFS